MTLKSVWLENKYEHKLISAQCTLTGKHGCRTCRFGSIAKRIVNYISDARKILPFPELWIHGQYFSCDSNRMVIKSLDVYFGQSYSSVGHQYTLVIQTINFNSTWVGQNVQLFPPHVGQFHEWVGQFPWLTNIYIQHIVYNIQYLSKYLWQLHS